jgi:hypothetical protein
MSAEFNVGPNMDFHQLFESWRSAREAGDEATIKGCVQSARLLSTSVDPNGWNWIESSLQDEDRKWFVAAVFAAQSLPKTLVNQMLHTGVLEKNPSFNRSFVEPCVKSVGAARVLSALLDFLRAGTDEEKAGAASALYWVPRQSDSESNTDLRQQIRCKMLYEFVNNEDLEVRRRIIPMLTLDERKYSEDFKPFIAKAIEIARSHPDDYIRHRVEIQLGSSGPFMAIPNTR